MVVETPKGSRNKYAFDPDNRVFELKKVLPAGMAFPYDFGFLPSTKCGDGDPLDVLVLIDEPAFPGCGCGDRKYWSHCICGRCRAAYASSIDLAGDDLRHARLAHNPPLCDLVFAEDRGAGGVASAIVPRIPSRTVSQRAGYGTMRFAETRPLSACSATLFCSCPAFPASSARAVASSFPQTVLKPFALKTAECYMPAMISPR